MTTLKSHAYLLFYVLTKLSGTLHAIARSFCPVSRGISVLHAVQLLAFFVCLLYRSRRKKSRRTRCQPI